MRQSIFRSRKIFRENILVSSYKFRHLTRRNLETERNVIRNYQPKVSNSSSNVIIKKQIGSSIVGIPRTDKQCAAAKAKRLSRLTSHRNNNFSLNVILRKGYDYTMQLDDLLGRFYKGLIRSVGKAIINPYIILVWSRKAWEVVKHEAKHYWAGFRLLGVEIRTSIRLTSKRLSGHSLTRRERKQLVRTTGDLFRVVPLSVFIFVPFMEFALPFALRLFPNMLPSTFEDQFKKEELMKKQLRLRIDIAEFMQDMVLEMGNKTLSVEQEYDPSDLERFIKDIRQGKSLPDDVLYKVSKLFSDDLTIDNMSHSELVLLCRYMDIAAYGHDSILRMQLRQKINYLRNDDRIIYFEGVDSLNLEELQHACQDRGMRATGLPKKSLQLQLTRWVDLSVNKDIPLSLLILSRAFIINDFGRQDIYSNAIKEAINQMDPDTAKIALAESFSSMDGLHADSTTLTERKLEAIRMQNQLIEIEKRQTRLQHDNKVKSSDGDGQLVETFEKIKEMASDSGVESETVAFDKVLEKQQQFLGHKSIIHGRIERKNVNYDVKPSGEDEEVVAPELTHAEVVQKRLQKRLGRFLKKLENDIEVVDEKIGDKMKILDLDRDGRVSSGELRQAIEQSFKQKLAEDEIDLVIKHLDIDNDGSIALSDINHVVGMLAEKKAKDNL